MKAEANRKSLPTKGPRVVVVGNAPSSGSTLLADLLDSSPHTASGPELALFASRRFYDFEHNREGILDSSSTPSLHATRVSVYPRALAAFGLDAARVRELARDAGNVSEFCRRFAERYLVLRSRDAEGAVFEKTPLNFGCIGQFLRSAPDSYFIHIVRNPLYIYGSLRKRNYSPYVALNTWLIAVATYLRYKAHPRVLLIRYEDLVEEPYAVTQKIIETVLGVTIDRELLERLYKNNTYRRLYEVRVTTWTQNAVGRVVSANKKVVSENDKQALASCLNTASNPAYGRLFGLESVSFEDALRELGYFDAFWNEVKDHYDARVMPTRGARDVAFLTRKWAGDVKIGDAAPRHWNTYLNPVIRHAPSLT